MEDKTEVVMIRSTLARGLGGLALAGSLGLNAWAGDDISPSTVRIYRTGNSAQQTPEQSVPRSTESKDAMATPSNGASAPAESKEEETTTWLQQHLEES